MQASSFGAVILLGNQPLWISAFRDYLHQCGGTITNPTHNGLTMTIYQTGGIDFIFPNVNLNELYEVNGAASKLKDFIQQKLYLEVHMLFFLNYMSPKFHQVLAFLSAAEIDIGIVSLIPGIATEEMYVQVCRELNLRPHFVNQRGLDPDGIKIILRTIFDTDMKHLFELFESCMK